MARGQRGGRERQGGSGSALLPWSCGLVGCHACHGCLFVVSPAHNKTHTSLRTMRSKKPQAQAHRNLNKSPKHPTCVGSHLTGPPPTFPLKSARRTTRPVMSSAVSPAS